MRLGKGEECSSPDLCNKARELESNGLVYRQVFAEVPNQGCVFPDRRRRNTLPYYVGDEAGGNAALKETIHMFRFGHGERMIGLRL